MTTTSLRRLHMRRVWPAFLCSVSLLVAGAPAVTPVLVHAASPTCSVSWTGAGSNNLWSNPANWSTHHVPGPSSDVCINTSTLSFISAVGNMSVHSLQVSNPNTLIIGASNAVGSMTVATTVDNGGSLQLDQGRLTAASINNTGGMSAVQEGMVTSPAFSNPGSLAVLSGTLTLTDAPTNLSHGTLTGGQWLVLSFGTLKLPGSITTLKADLALGSGPIINSLNGSSAVAGLTSIDAGAQLSADGPDTVAVSGNLTNNGGTVILGGYQSPGTLTIGGTYTQLPGGFATLTDGTLTAKQVKVANGSAFEMSAATVLSDLTNAGFVSTAGSASKVTGTYAQTSSGTLQAGFSNSPFAVSGAASLAGSLQVYTFLSPTPGSTATVMSFASRTGSFTSVTVGFQATLSNTKVTLVANPQIVVSPSTVTPGQTVTISGGDFGQDDSVTIGLGIGSTLATVKAAINGSFRTTVTIPNNVPAGTEAVIATATSGRSAQTSIQVS